MILEEWTDGILINKWCIFSLWTKIFYKVFYASCIYLKFWSSYINTVSNRTCPRFFSFFSPNQNSVILFKRPLYLLLLYILNGLCTSIVSKCYFSSVTQSCLILCDPLDCSMLGFAVHKQLRNLLKHTSMESVMASNHLIFCHPLLCLPSVFPSIRVFSSESVLHIRWPKYWGFKLQHQSFQ